MQEAVLFPFLFRLIRLRGGSFLQELYDFEKILAVKRVNVDTLLLNFHRLPMPLFIVYSDRNSAPGMDKTRTREKEQIWKKRIGKNFWRTGGPFTGRQGAA
jgi:hypothetical protein